MKRNYAIVYFRVIATLMIVLFHCYCYNLGVWSFLEDSPQAYDYFCSPRILSTIGLSVFVVISGYLYGFGFFYLSKYRNNSSLLKKKIFRLVIPYTIWALITYVVFYASVYWKQLLGGIGHLWFLLMLFNCFLIASLTKSIWKRIGKFYFVLLIGLLYLLTYRQDSSILKHLWFMSINRTIPWLYLFFVGIFLGKYNVLREMPMHNRIPPKWVLFIDRNSMGVYILHHIFIWLAIYNFTSVREFIIGSPIYAPWILFLIVLPISLFFSEYIGKLKYSIYIFG